MEVMYGSPCLLYTSVFRSTTSFTGITPVASCTDDLNTTGWSKFVWFASTTSFVVTLICTFSGSSYSISACNREGSSWPDLFDSCHSLNRMVGRPCYFSHAKLYLLYDFYSFHLSAVSSSSFISCLPPWGVLDAFPLFLEGTQSSGGLRLLYACLLYTSRCV